MMDPLSSLVDTHGHRLGQADLVQQVRSWLLDARVQKLHIQHGPSSKLEMMMVAQGLAKLSPLGLAKVICWLTKHRVVRLAVARAEIQMGRKRAEVKEELRGLREWAEQTAQQRASLVLPN